MSLIIKAGENRSYEIKNKRIRGVSLNVALVANAVNVAFLPSDFDATNVQVKVDLLRGGKTKSLFADNLLALIAASYMSNFALLHPKNSTIDNMVLVHDTAVTEKRILPFFCDFGSIVDLEGSDSCVVTVNFQQSAQVGVNLVGSTNSYIDIVELERHGFEKATPSIETSTIKAGESKLSFPLGNGIRRIVLLNYDKDDILASSAPSATIALTSDKVSYSATTEQRIQERQQDFFLASSEETLRRQSLVLYDGVNGNLNNCQVDFTLIPANVNVGKNVLVVWRNETSAGLILHGTAKEEATKAQRYASHGIGVGAKPQNLSNLNRNV